MLSCPTYPNAIRIFNDHQLDALPRRVSGDQLAFLGIGNVLIDTTRQKIPTSGNHALHVSRDELSLNRLERVRRATSQLLAERRAASEEPLSDLAYACVVQAVAQAAGVGACMEYAASVFADAVRSLWSDCTIEMEGDEATDHCWVKITAPGLTSIVLDAWIPGSHAVLEQDHAFHSPKGGLAQATLLRRARGEADVVRSPGEVEALEDEAALLQEQALKTYEETDHGEVSVKTSRVRVSSSVTHSGRPMAYFA